MNSKPLIVNYFYFIFLFWINPIFLSYSQDIPEVKEVQEFYVGFMDNLAVGELALPALVITALEEDVEGYIEFQGNRVSFSLNNGEVYEYIGSNNLITRSSGQVEQKSFYIYSEGEVSVYAINQKEGSFDGTLVLPLDKIGSDYFIGSHYEQQSKGISLSLRQGNNESQILIVGTQDNTEIEINPSSPVNNSTDPIRITLNTGEVYQIKSKGDLSGTQVRVTNGNDSCARIAVFSGNKFADIGDPECGTFSTSHIFNQNEPISSWGKHYFHIPLPDRQLGELVKFIAAFDDTQIFEGSDLLTTLDAGEFFTRDVPDGQSLEFTSSKPVGVFGFGKSYSCEILDANSVLSPANVANYGNPQQVNYSPFEDLKYNLTINFHPVFNTAKHFAQLVVKSEDVGLMMIDGSSVGGQFRPISNNPDFSFAQIQLSTGIHTLSNEGGFTGYFYAVGASQSYALDFGDDFSNSEYELLSSFDDLKSGSPRIACLNQEGNWEINSLNPNFQFFTWDFGDESGRKVGKSVRHTFTDPGIYPVKVFASEDESGCEETEIYEFEVEVEELGGRIIGPEKACPQVDELDYFFEGIGEIASIEWKVEGGIILEETQNQIKVKWGDENPDAMVQAIPISSIGCQGIPIEFSVQVKQELEPQSPIGPEFICDFDMEYTYSIPMESPNREYIWFVEGGNLINGNQGPEIKIQWIEDAESGQVYFQESSTLDEFCSGDSPVLDVALNSGFEIDAEEVIPVSCFGESNGRIEVSVSGGSPPFRYSWNHDPDLNSPLAENLPPGIYSLVVSDSQGCERKLENLEVLEPGILTLVNEQIQNPSCFGKADGQVFLEVTGGTPPYRVDSPDVQINSGTLILENLEMGEFEFTLMDASGCTIPLAFSLVSPDPFEVEMVVSKAPCPSESNGIILAEPQGGSPPYSFEWNNGSTQARLENVGIGEYEVRIIDSQGCVSIGTTALREAPPEIRFPTGFNPKEGSFGPVSNCGELSYTLSIFNRWGQLIYAGNSPWDGTIAGKPSPMGTYSFRFDFESQINDEIIRKSQLGSFLKIQ